MNNFGARFGALVKERRGVEGLTQQALAVIAFGEEGKKARVSELENGHVEKPHQRIIDALSVALDLSAQEIEACRKPNVPKLENGFLSDIGLTDEIAEALSWNFAGTKPQATTFEYAEFLRLKAQELAALQSRLGHLPVTSSELIRLRTVAEAAISAGRFQEAESALEEGEQTLLKERTLKAVREQSEWRATRGLNALLNDDPSAAYEHFLCAAEYFTPFDAHEGAKHREAFSDLMHNYGRSHGGPAVEHAYNLLHVNLDFYSKNDDTAASALTKWSMASTLRLMGRRLPGQDGLAYLVNSLEVYGAFGSLLDEANVSLPKRVEMQLDHADAIVLVADRLSNDRSKNWLLQALEKYVLIKPLINDREISKEWFSCHLSLGSCLRKLGIVSEGLEQQKWFSQSVDILRELVTQTDGSEVIEGSQKALARTRLGNSLNGLSHNVVGLEKVSLLQEAIEHLEIALESWDEHENPADWALCGNNLGNALSRLARSRAATLRQGDTSEFDRAVDCLRRADEVFEAVLRVRTRSKYPYEWALVMENRGLNYELLSFFWDGQNELDLQIVALDHFRAALEMFDSSGSKYNYDKCKANADRLRESISKLTA